MRVEPALAAAAERTEPQIGCLQPAEIVGKRFPVHQHDVGAFRLLHLVVGEQRVLAGLAREQEIAALAKADVGVGAETGLEVAEERDPERAHADVFRRGKLLADRGGRQGRGGVRIGRVALDHGDRAVKAEIVGEEIGRRGADRSPTHDDHVETLGTHTLLPSIGQTVACAMHGG